MTGEDLKSRRKGMGYTQDGLARVLGVSRKTVNEMENGARIDKRTEMAVLSESRRVQVRENTVWVEPTIRGTYAVARRLIREIDHPRAMLFTDGETTLFGEFKRRDQAYRWCAALHRSDNARETRDLTRKRRAMVNKAGNAP